MADVTVERITTPISELGGIPSFFAFMRERQSAYLKKTQGWDRPWTVDPILHKYRFTNIFRENDRTTIWFRDNIRDKYAGGPEALLAIAVFRWFNRMETGRALFLDTDAFDRFLATHDVQPMYEALMDRIGTKGPYVTGAHMVYAVPGMPLHEGVLYSIKDFVAEKDTRVNALKRAELMYRNPGDFGIEDTWRWLEGSFFGMGSFLSYEVTTDLRHTRLLDQARDIMTWANAGPGSTRGANCVFGRPFKKVTKREQVIEEMRYLLSLTKGTLAEEYGYWPNNEDYPPLEMRDIEHALCEFSKYRRVIDGLGCPRGVYR